MTVTFEIPSSLELLLKESGSDPSVAAKEAALVEFFRQHRIDHPQLAACLGTSHDGADAILKRHGVMLETTLAEIDQDVRELRWLLNP